MYTGGGGGGAWGLCMLCVYLCDSVRGASGSGGWVCDSSTKIPNKSIRLIERRRRRGKKHHS